jgi:hypothetical protein
LEKEKTNSLYGLIVKGMSDKRLFDAKNNDMVRLAANDLSNPLLAT